MFSGRKNSALIRKTIASLVKDVPGIVVEFGVYKGKSISHFAKLMPSTTIYGFDSFDGFPDDGRTDWNKNFAVDHIPDCPKNVTLLPGMFAETLPAFVDSMDKTTQIKLLHIDCDLYSSTKTVFDHLGEHIRIGDIILFDELLFYNRFLQNELLAFFGFLSEYNLDFEWALTQGKALSLEVFFELTAPGSPFKSGKMAAFRDLGYFQSAAVRICERPTDWSSRLERFNDDSRKLAGTVDLAPHFSQ